MILVLLFVCIVFMLLVRIINKQEFFSPTFISSGMLAVGSLVYLIYYSTLKKDISAYTVYIIAIALFALYCGEIIASFTKTHCRCSNQKKVYISVNNVTTEIIIIFMIVTLILRLLDAKKYIGGSFNIIEIISRLRHFVVVGEYVVPAYLRYMTWMAEDICYIYEFVYLSNRIICGKRNNINLLPVIIYALISLTSTGRTDLIKVVVGFIAIGLLIFYEIRPKGGIPFKILKKIGIGLAVFGIIFFFIGSVRSANSSASHSNPVIDSVFSYIGAPIYGLDYELNNNILERSQYFGYYTLQEIYGFFGISHDIKPAHHLIPFKTVGSSFSNIYTSIVFPILDYGVMGLVVTRIILSFIFTRLYYKFTCLASNNHLRFIFLVLIIDLYYSFFMFGIADRFIHALLYPQGIIRHTIIVWLIAKYVLRLKFKTLSKEFVLR